MNLVIVIKDHFLFSGEIYINKETKEITRLHPYSVREIPNDEEIQDLIQAGLVEKVEEE